ncbi:polysaccharide biosynthesis tyrosine autokinase [Pseudarthrobacter sp. NIBRBAC000502771]|uniref:polysaccharide biosynthesis tyrosine autokinase n=1 Tax=Pseudarthrobacter sp. NIBRBAC000502771 TaxID=2590774 RepID=UPI001FEED60F|nr:polysaccharide biosynthesis tyrosine autokinase [Pseudarthrobacter sp. NIBRBAC000502771]
MSYRHRGTTVLDLSAQLLILRRGWVTVVALALAGLLAGGAASVLTKPTYTAETQLFVAIQSSGTVQELQQGNTFTQARVQSYVKTVDSPIVLQPAIDALGLAVSAEELAPRISAKTDLNTVLITISVNDGSPVQAAAIAEAVANSLVKAVDSLEKPKTGGSSPVSLSVIKPAKAPATPSAPNTRLNLLAGLILGLALGIGTAILRANLDKRIRGEEDVRRLSDTPVLGAISFDPEAAVAPLVTSGGSQHRRSEAFRQLRTNLQFANVAGKAKSVLITSSLPGEGKSTTATNLAITLAQAGQSVCLVDADLRRPMVNEYLGLDRNAGLTTALVGAADVSDLLQPWGEDGLYALTSGQIPPNPSELLGSADMQLLLARLEDSFDNVIIDAPPLLPVTDAAVLAQLVGGVVLVVGAQKLKLHDLEKSLASLRLVEANLLGVILNRLPVKARGAYDYEYYSHESKPRQGHESTKSRRARRATTHVDIAQADLEHRPTSPNGRLVEHDHEPEERSATRFPSDRFTRKY